MQRPCLSGRSGCMSDKYVFLSLVDLIDDDVFSESTVRKWRNHLLDSYEEVFRLIKAQIDSVSSLKFFISDTLVNEAIADAIIGLRKVIYGAHPIENPNAFKVASYLAYWWLRHKPVSIHYPKNYSLETVQIVDGEYDKENEQQKVVWRLKHINELVAVQIVVSYIFNFSKALCGKHECKRIKKAGGSFSFVDFEEMKTALLQKLTYYFSYRAITPKVIEHILEGYTFHPAWDLTGKMW